MKHSNDKPQNLHGMAALFDETERKQFFRHYLYFLLWIELGILFTFCLYHLGDSADGGESSFPWRLYFLIAFLTPIAITFVTGTIIVGFTRYFGEEEVSGADEFRYEAASVGQNGRLEQLDRVVAAIRKLPYPALLLLLGIGSALVYNLGAITGMAEDAGMRAMKIIFITLAIAVFLGSVFGIILIILNYRLRKAEMEYHYKNQVAEKLGLVILDDHTVVDSSGKLLVGGEKLGEAAPLLPEISQDPEIAERGLTDGLQQTVGPPAKPMNVDQFLSKESH